ncbi:hypothetical protein [Syntrophomonas palmitatica]|uniref:hypothetical protein n=1 Tax=Syntrophomonas palmitatica TaxID=402877 RepID=UPI0012EE1110|nr:hypothetical protein [Syntrophomonas palmitatica]
MALEVTEKRYAVTNHAIKQYKEKFRKYDLTDNEALKALLMIAKRGSVVTTRPGDCWEIRYNGMSVVATLDNDTILVITFLGDKNYRHWVRKTEIYPRYMRYKGGRGA